MVHGLDRGCPAIPRHPYERYQVCYREGTRQRSAGVFPTKRRADVATKWWPAWKDQHPTSEYGTRKKVEKRILSTFGSIPLGDLDASTIGAWKAAMLAEQLSPQTVNTYLSLLGTILNAAVDDDYLARSPGAQERSRPQPAGPPPRGLAAARALDRLVEAIDPRYRALVQVAALTGMRWGELVALRWDDPRLDQPLDDGAVRGPGRLRIARAISDPRRTGRGVEKGPKTEAGKRMIALDQETVQALLTHRELVGGGAYDRIFTSPGGSRGPAGFGSGPWPRPSWRIFGPSTVGCTSTTCGIPMPLG
jgi:integrase